MEKKNNDIVLYGKTVLITGVAGFIGSFLAKFLTEQYQYIKIIGYDNLNSYYDIRLKETRLKGFIEHPNFCFIKGNIADRKKLKEVFHSYVPDIVVNLAAQAGVRYSITNPEAYMESNVTGFFNLLECCRNASESGNPVQHLVYASSSSVYGGNKKLPYSVEDKVDNPLSFYAATKKSNELMAHAYSKLYRIPSTGLRFFTVYGPMGRPDMAYFKFTDKMVKGDAIQVYNHGNMYRDFTYIDDIVTGIAHVMKRLPGMTEDDVPYKIYNIGNNKPESLLNFIETLEKCLMEEHVIKAPAVREYLPMQPGDVYQTYADSKDLMIEFGFKPGTSLEAGLREFVKWYKDYRQP